MRFFLGGKALPEIKENIYRKKGESIMFVLPKFIMLYLQSLKVLPF